MFKFKFELDLSMGIQVWVVWILEPFRVPTNSDNWTIEFGYWTAKNLCEFWCKFSRKFYQNNFWQSGLDIANWYRV